MTQVGGRRVGRGEGVVTATSVRRDRDVSIPSRLSSPSRWGRRPTSEPGPRSPRRGCNRGPGREETRVIGVGRSGRGVRTTFV